MSVVDVSAPSPNETFCKFGKCGPNNFVHFAGGEDCRVPGPPDGCHHYVVTEYADGCVGVSGELQVGWDGGRFGADGALKDCKAFVRRQTTTCFQPPAASPVACDCEASAHRR